MSNHHADKNFAAFKKHLWFIACLDQVLQIWFA